jgi:hypothetical protein
MRRDFNREKKLGVAVLSGVIVALAATAVHLATLPIDRTIIVHELIGDFVAGLTTIVVCLAIQLRQEEVHYRTAIDRAAIIAEVNHHIRNAVFPLSLAVQKTGDAESIRVANEAVERINIALKDATADALSRRIEYGEGDVLSLEDRAA